MHAATHSRPGQQSFRGSETEEQAASACAEGAGRPARRNTSHDSALHSCHVTSGGPFCCLQLLSTSLSAPSPAAMSHESLTFPMVNLLFSAAKQQLCCCIHKRDQEDRVLGPNIRRLSGPNCKDARHCCQYLQADIQGRKAN